MSAPQHQMRPWDETPKRRALEAAANILYNANLSGRPGSSVDRFLAPYLQEGAEEVLKANWLRGLAEDRRLAGRASAVHAGTSGPETAHGYYFADSIHASGQAIPSNFMARPRVAATVGFVLGAPLEHRDTTLSEIFSRVATVHAAIVVESQRTGDPQRSTLLERIADNAHASHVVLSARTVRLQDLETEQARLSLTTTGGPTVCGLHPDLALHLVRAVRQSIAALGPVQAGEVLVAPSGGGFLDLPLGSKAVLESPQFGSTTAIHAPAEYEEGFLPMSDGISAES